MPRGSRSGKKVHRRIGENGTNSWTTWSKITTDSSPKRGEPQWGKRDMAQTCTPQKTKPMGIYIVLDSYEEQEF